LGAELNEHSNNNSRLPNFRWRIIPSFCLIGMSLLTFTRVFGNVYLGVPLFHSAHFLIFVSAIIWLIGAIFCFRGNWRLAVLATLIGVVLPFFRPIY